MSVTVIHSAPKVSAKANDAIPANKGKNEHSSVDDSFSDSLNDEVKAIEKGSEEKPVAKKTTEEKTKADSDEMGQENSALESEALPHNRPTKVQEIDLDETLIALNDIVSQLSEESSDLLADVDGNSKVGLQNVTDDSKVGLQNVTDDSKVGLQNVTDDSKVGLQNAIVQLDKQIESKVDVDGLKVAKQALLNAEAKQLAQAGKIDTAALVKPEKINSDTKSYASAAQAKDKNGSSHLGLSSLLKNDAAINELPLDKVVTKLADLSTLGANDQAAPKNIIGDLAALNRQVETMQANKQEVPAMTKPFNHPEWKQEFNDRIIWMQNKGIPSAELRINPNNLGPISIRIKMDADQQANIAINVQNAGVREAVEAALPRLREMLNAQQIGLADVNVSQQQQQGQGNARQAMEEAQGESNKENADQLAQSSELDEDVNDIANEINRGRAVASKGLLSIYA